MMIIDPPSPFAPLEEWQLFLREMEDTVPQNDEDREQVEAAITEAKAQIAQRSG